MAKAKEDQIDEVVPEQIEEEPVYVLPQAEVVLSAEVADLWARSMSDRPFGQLESILVLHSSIRSKQVDLIIGTALRCLVPGGVMYVPAEYQGSAYLKNIQPEASSHPEFLAYRSNAI